MGHTALIVKTLLIKDITGWIALAYVKTYCKATLIRTGWYLQRFQRSKEQKRKFRNKLTEIWPFDFWQMCKKQFKDERIVFSKKGVRTIGHLHARKWT